MRVVLDASALVAYLGLEAGHELVAEALAAAADRENPVLMGAVNWGEAAYIMAGRAGWERTQATMNALASFPIDVVPVDREFAERAGEFKSSGKLGYADGFAAALAESSGGELLTADRDFESVRKDIKIRMIR